MKKTIILMAFFLSACSGSQYSSYTPTPNPGEIALQMLQQQVASEATAQIVSSQFTATAQILGATATQQAYNTEAAIVAQARLDAQATSDQERRDVQATQQRLDKEATQAQEHINAQSTADQARLDLYATQTAEASATAYAMTQRVVATHDWWTATAVEQEIILKNNVIEKSNLDVQQERDTNKIQWQFPLFLALCVLIVGSVYFIRKSRTTEFKNDDGKIEILLFDNKTALKPALMTGPVFKVGEVTVPNVSDPSEQARVTERAQIVEALSVMPDSPSSATVETFNRYFSREDKPEKRFEFLGEGKMPPAELLNPETLKVIDGEWKDAQDE